jgi:hypothetical protein
MSTSAGQFEPSETAGAIIVTWSMRFSDWDTSHDACTQRGGFPERNHHITVVRSVHLCTQDLDGTR